MRTLLAVAIVVASMNPSLAQWKLVETPTIISMASECMIKPESSFPHLIVPYAEDSVIYTNRCFVSPSNGYWSSLYLTPLTTTVPSFVTQPGTGNNGVVSILHCGGDDFLYRERSNGGVYGLYFTSDRFKTRIQILNQGIETMAATQNYLYGAENGNSPNGIYLQIHRRERANVQTGGSPVCAYVLRPTKLEFINDSVGFLLGTKFWNGGVSYLIKTTDYCNTWSVLQIDSINPIKDINVLNNGTIFMLRGNGIIHRSLDSGTTFSMVSGPLSSTYTCMRFENAENGFVGGVSGTLLYTSNGGLSWNNQTGVTTSAINSIFIINNNCSYFVDGQRKLFKSGQVLGLKQTDSQSEFVLFPNPVSTAINLQIDGRLLGKINYEITDLSGKVVKSGLLESTIDVPDLENGTYIFRSQSEKEIVVRKLLILR